MEIENLKNEATEIMVNMESLREDLKSINLDSKIDILSENLRKIIDEKIIDEKEYFYLLEDLRDTIIDFHSFIFENEFEN
ncbi:MAG: hypothetical protein EOM78_14115 [Erysipelotrichia bacterium]|nr:hypothetical protein [Erysipelotrichia bacterium]